MTPFHTSQAFFDDKYRTNADPWDFSTSEYEQQRYATILAALKHRRYRRAFEPGCSVGVLTEYLAHLCTEVHASDISPTAAELARSRCQRLANVTVACASLPDSIPDMAFDLVVLSEIGYYFEAEQLLAVGKSLTKRMDRHGVLLAAHWLGSSPDHLLGGDRVHDILSKLPGLDHDYAERQTGFRVDRWVKR